MLPSVIFHESTPAPPSGDGSSTALVRALDATLKQPPKSLSWRTILSPYLTALLQDSNSYTQSTISSHVSFFSSEISPWLSPPAATLEPSYLSRLTPGDHTPFEPSICWKGPTSRPVIRYAVDLFPISGSPDAAGRFQALCHTLAMLPSLPTPGFPELWEHITRFFIVHEREVHSVDEVKNCSVCAPSSAFLGFDLVAEKASPKLYWLLPACQSELSLLATVSSLFSSCAPLHPLLASQPFQSAWSTLETYLSSHPDILRLRMLSLDATKYPFPRFKVYARCTLPSSSKEFRSQVLPHLTLGGQLSLGEGFVAACAGLWDAIAGEGTKSCLLLWEIGVEGKVRGKLYIMRRDLEISDSDLAEKILEWCPVVDGRNTLDGLKEYAGRESERGEKSKFIAEIGLGPSGSGETELAVYFNTNWFARVGSVKN